MLYDIIDVATMTFVAVAIPWRDAKLYVGDSRYIINPHYG
jgi:hypothetical protein